MFLPPYSPTGRKQTMGAMELALYWTSAAVLLALAIWLGGLYRRGRSIAALCTLIVAAGLIYDNAVIAAGSLMGPGPLLEALNWPRYVVHAFATPLLIIVALDFAHRWNLAWASRPLGRFGLIGLTLAMIAYGVIFELLPLSLVVESADGVISYAPAGGAGVPVPAMATMVALAAVGIILWAVRGWPWLAVGALLAFVGFGLAPALDFEVLGQLAEVVLIGGIAVTELRVIGLKLRPVTSALRQGRVSVS